MVMEKIQLKMKQLGNIKNLQCMMFTNQQLSCFLISHPTMYYIHPPPIKSDLRDYKIPAQ